MDEGSKIQLSPHEKELVVSPDLILTKNRILKKAQLLLTKSEAINHATLQAHADSLPVEIFRVPPKISRGENYLGLPWLILDQPRLFSNTDVFAIRTLFWWGRFFSCTLHLAGRYKERYQSTLVSRFSSMAENGFYCCVNENQWEHHFERANYVSMTEMDEDEFSSTVASKPFTKIAVSFPVAYWDQAAEMLSGKFSLLISWLA